MIERLADLLARYPSVAVLVLIAAGTVVAVWLEKLTRGAPPPPLP